MKVSTLIEQLEQADPEMQVIFNVPIASGFPWDLNKAKFILAHYEPNDGFIITDEHRELYYKDEPLPDTAQRTLVIQLDL